jgi:hypothetical protein
MPDSVWGEFDAPAAPTSPEPAGSASVWGELLHSNEVAPAEYAGRSHRAGLAAGRSPEEHAKLLKDRGFADESVKRLTQNYKLDYETQNLGRFEGGKETIAGSLVQQAKEHFVPFRSWFVDPQKEEADAAQRFQQGNANDDDIKTLAVARRRNEDRERLHSTFAGELVSALRDAPAIFGEYAAGAGLLKGAGILQAERVSRLGAIASGAGRTALLTAAMPSQYMDLARQKNLEAGRPADSWKGLPPAGLHAFAHLVVLGSVFRSAGGIRAGLLPGAVDALKVGGKGAMELALADEATRFADLFVPEAYKISSGQGVFEKLMNGDVSGASRKYALDSLTLAAFAGLHRMADGLSPAESAEVAKGGALVLAKDGPQVTELLKRQARLDDPENANRLFMYFYLRQQGVPADAAYQRAYGTARGAGVAGKPALGEAPRQLAALRVEPQPGEVPEPPGPKPPADVSTAVRPPTVPQATPSPELTTTPAAPEIVAPAKAGASEKPTVTGPERYYRVPGSKGPPDNVDAVISELVGGQFAGKWFSRTREGNAGYHVEGRAQLEFRDDRLGGEGDKVERGEKDVLIGATAPMYLHPALSAIRFKGRSDSPQFEKLSRLMESVNEERVKAGLDLVTVEATQPATLRVDNPAVKPLVKFLAPEQVGEIDPAKAGKWLARGLLKTPGVNPTDAAALVSVVKGETSREAAGKQDVSHQTIIDRAERAFQAAKEHWGKPLESFASAQDLADTLRGERRAGLKGEDEFGKSFLKNFMSDVEGTIKLDVVVDLIKNMLWRGGDWLKWMAGGGKGRPPGVKLDPGHVLPRPQDWGEYKQVVSEQQGAGRIPFLRWLFDPGRSDTSPEGEVFVAHQALKETGKDVAALWAIQEKEADRLFRAGADGMYERGAGGKGHMADDIEAEMRNPGSVAGMSTEQRAWVKNTWTPLLRDAQAMLGESGVKSWTDSAGNPIPPAGAYFPRQAVGKKNVDVTGGIGGRPGAAAHFEKGRLYETESEGAKEILYDPSAKSRVAKFIAEVYRTIADHNLATDAALGGKTVTERFEALQAANAALLKTLSPAAKDDLLAELRERAGHPVWGKESFVGVGPAFAGKIYPADIAKKIEGMYRQDSADWMKRVEKISAAAKGVTLGGDASYAFIQLLPTLFRSPLTWAKAMKESTLSIFDRNRLGKYLEQSGNADAARELTQLGSSVGRLQDFMSGLAGGEFASKIPVLGKVYEATGRAFGVALDVAKIELWKAWKPVAKPHELRALAEAIDSMLLSGRMESIGLSPRRAMSERLMMLAPSYYRGGLNLIATAFQRGVAGDLARQALGATMAGVAISAVAAMKAVGLSDDDVEERLNPAKGKFLKVPVDLGDNQKLEVGYGNILTSYVRLMGAAADHFSSDKPVDTGADGNPMLRWLRGKAAFSPRLMIDLWTGKDFFGKRQEPQDAVLRSFEPLALQQIIHGDHAVFEHGAADPQAPARSNVADAITSLFGLTSYSGSDGDARLSIYNREARTQFNKSFSELSLPQQAAIVKASQSSPDMPPKKPPTADEMERAFSVRAERQRSIMGTLSDDAKKKLGDLGEDVPAPTATVHVNGADVPLSNTRMRQYEGLLSSEYDATVSRWDVSNLKGMSADVRKKWIEAQFKHATERAKRKLMGETAG